jgi:hypothetical protein
MSINQCESLEAAISPQESLLPLQAPSSNTAMKPWQASFIKQSTQQRGKGRTKRGPKSEGATRAKTQSGSQSSNWTTHDPEPPVISFHFWTVTKMSSTVSNWARGVSHCGLAIYILKYLKAKEELWKLKYFTAHKYNLQKTSKRTKILQDIITLQLISSFKNKQKYYLSKILI